MEKIKNLPVMRFVAFAIALVFILGLSSVMLSFTASADSVSDIPSSITGTFGNYSSVKFTASNQIFDPSTVFTQFDTKSYYGVFVYEKDGKLVVYDDLSTYRSNGHMHLDFAHGLLSSPENVLLYVLKTDRFKDSSSEQALYFNDYVMLSQTKSEFNYSDLEANLPLNVFPSRFITFDGFTDLYLIYTTATGILSESDCKLKIADMTAEVNKMSISQWQGSDSSTAPKAEFITCASFEPVDNTTIPLWFKDFTSEGQQYPLFTYYVHDNGNKHSYSLKLSYSESAKESVKKVFNLRENTPADSDSATKDLIERIVAMYALHGVKIHDLTPYLRTALNLKFPNNLIYNQSFVLSSPEMDFSTTGDNKVYTICLSDYSDILQCLIYKAEIIDNNTGLVLDTTYFTIKQTFNKGNSGFGSKVYDYGDNYNGMIDDIKNNTPSVEPSNKDSFISKGDVINTTKYDYYSGLKIDDIFGSLQSSASSLGSFFQACMNIIPAGILAVIIGGLSIVIVLRILGR